MSKPTDIENALGRARHYCAFQDRCIKELSDKLRGWKVKPVDAEKVIQQMQEEGYINEERFARVYASGRFRLKHWGKTKIAYELRGKGISDELIKLALEEIDEEEYKEALNHLLVKKNKEIKDEDTYVRKKKLVSFALQKGYEYEIVKEMVSKMEL
jgi:regulatory protein